MRTVRELEREAESILLDAIVQYGPRAVFVLCSGGNDSRSLLAWADGALKGNWFYKGAALIDTGIALEEAHENVRAFCSAHGVPLQVQRTRERYEDFVRAHGFPGPAQHYRMYQRLKERAVESLVRNAKAMRRDRVMLLTGVRRQESRRRMLLTYPVQRKGAQVWVNPLFGWSTDERDFYMEAKGIERNSISGKICGSSGDCLCGAMAEEGELADLDYWYPDDPSVKLIHQLQDECAELGLPCKWGHKPNGKPARSRRPDRPMYMCVGCENRAEP